MGEAANRIEHQIQEHRRDIDEGIAELRHKAAQAVDWRYYVDQHPAAMMGLAFGGGVLLSALVGGSRRPSAAHPAAPGRQSEVWSVLKGTLAGIAGAKIKGLVEEFVPGLHEEYRKAEQEHRAQRAQDWRQE